jgi:hypothetical protein
MTRSGSRDTSDHLEAYAARRRRDVALALLVLLFAHAPSLAGGRRSVELLLGTVSNLSTPLTVRQGGEREIDFTARYESRPLSSPLYYTVRLALEDRTGAWELQLVHHKLYLSNPPAEIQHFEITHGYNLLTLNRAFAVRGTTLRVGAGIVLAHTESTVRGLEGPDGGILDTGYRLTGPSLSLGAGRAFAITDDLDVLAEIQATGARARVPVANGTADAPNVALHFLLGLGYRF